MHVHVSSYLHEGDLGVSEKAQNEKCIENRKGRDFWEVQRS
jgi:hypothetical protein